MIPFTQYLRPAGRTRVVRIDRPAEVEATAHRLIDAGVRFEAEVLTTGEVSLTAEDRDGEQLAIEVVPNGPGVSEAVDRLVAAARDSTGTGGGS